MSTKLKVAVWVAVVIMVSSMATAVAVVVMQVIGHSNSTSTSSGSTTLSLEPSSAPALPATRFTVPKPSTVPAASAAYLAAAVPVVVPEGFDVLLWSDEFDGTSLNTSKWMYDGAGTQGVGEQGQTSDGLQVYTPDNVKVANGSLHITAHKNNGQYSSGRINSSVSGGWFPGMQLSNGKKVQRLFIQARIQVPKGGSGLWAAFWMAPKDPNKYGKWPASGEIDIMEAINDQKTIVQGLHYGGAWPDNEKSTVDTKQDGGDPYSDGFHIFGAEWERDFILVGVDGRRCYKFNNWWTSKGGADWPAPFDQPFNFVLNLAVGGQWPGTPDDTTPFPATLAVDYVRVFAKLG